MIYMFDKKKINNLQQALGDNPWPTHLTNRNYKTWLLRQTNYLLRFFSQNKYGLETTMIKKLPDNQTWCTPHSLKDSNVNPKVKTTKEGIGVCSLVRSTLGIGGRVGASRLRLGWVTSGSIIHIDLHNPNNKLVSVWLENFWCMDKPWAYTNSHDSPQPGLGGSHHLPPYIILCV
jgi:hypothetical protein